MKSAKVAEVRIKHNGVDLETKGIIIEYVLSRCHHLYYVPFVEISMIDSKGYFGTNGITDYTALEVYQGSDTGVDDPTEWTTYLKLSCNPFTLGGVRGYKFTGYLAGAHQYLMERVKKKFSGTSNSIIQEIALECGMQAVTATTFDPQDRWSQNKTWAEFVYQDIIPHAYCRDDSCLLIGVDFDGIIRVPDISRIMRGSPVALFSNVMAPGIDYLAAEWSEKSNSGLLNKQAGWGMKTIENNIVTGVRKVFDAINVSKKERSIDVDPRAQVTSSIHLPTLNVGNVNDNHSKATHQNKRMKSLFSSTTEILTRSPTKVEMFNLIKFSAYNGTDLLSTSSGFFVAVGKARYTSQKEYAEKLIVTRNSTNASEGTSE